jgi:ATP-binding cassette, subfamily B, bacterial
MSGDRADKPAYGAWGMYRRLVAIARPFWLHIAASFLLSLLATPLGLLAPLPLKLVVDSVIGSHPMPRVAQFLMPADVSRSTLVAIAVGLIVAIAFAQKGLELLTTMVRTYTGEQLALGFKAILFRHVQRLSFSYHDAMGVSDSTYRIQYNAPAIQWILVDGIIPLVSSGATLIGIVVVTARIDLPLAVVAMAISPVLFGLSWFFATRLRQQWREVYTLQSSAMSVVNEALGAIRVVTAFGQETREQQRFEHQSTAGFRAQMRATFAEGAFNLLVGVTTAAGTALVLWIGVRHVLAGALTVGDLLVVMAYLVELYGPLSTLSAKVAHLQRSFSAAERAFAVLDETPDVPDRPHGRRIARASGGIAFSEVSFAYDPSQLVLQDITFDLPAGTRLGIAGRTGAGKTTLVSLGAASCSTVSIFATTASPTCGISLRWSCRSRCSSPTASARTSATRGRA